jgi:hypothetical protein
MYIFRPAGPISRDGGVAESFVARSLVSGMSEVERTEDDLPCKIHDVPQLRLIHTQCDTVLPKRRNVACVGGESLEVAHGMCAEIGGELVELGTRSESLREDSTGMRGGKGLSEGERER